MPRTARRRRRLSLTALIDVIFLLLLFFMLTSTFTRFAEIEIAAAAPGGGAADRPPLFLQLGAEEISLNGDAVALSGLVGALDGVSGGEERSLLVSLGPYVSAQRLSDLLVTLADAPGIAPTVLGGNR